MAENQTGVATKGLAIIGGLSLLGLGVKKAVENVIANIEIVPGNPSMDNTPFANGFIQTNIPLNITNHNPFAIGVKSFFGDITYGELNLGSVAIPVGFHVPAKSSRIVGLDFNIPIAQVTSDLLGLIQQGNIFNAVLNTIDLNGVVQLSGNFLNAPIRLNNITIPIV